MVPRLKLPLFPLADVVHFPHTELRLHIFEPRYRQLVEDLAAKDEDDRLIGMLLVCERNRSGAPLVSGAGTAGRLVGVEPLPDGRFDIELLGAFRFRVEREVSGKPYRQGIVQPWREPDVEESAPELVALQQALCQLTREVARETGDQFPLDEKRLLELGSLPLETLVNSLAAGLDLPAMRKLQLLSSPLPERGQELLSILGGRKTVLEKLRPFRHLVGKPELN